jgi:hypothetical protein
MTTPKPNEHQPAPYSVGPVHVLTVVAVERLSGLSPTEEALTSRRPTAFQTFLDQSDILRSKSWRTLGNSPRLLRDPRL